MTPRRGGNGKPQHLGVTGRTLPIHGARAGPDTTNQLAPCNAPSTASLLLHQDKPVAHFLFAAPARFNFDKYTVECMRNGPIQRSFDQAERAEQLICCIVQRGELTLVYIVKADHDALPLLTARTHAVAPAPGFSAVGASEIHSEPPCDHIEFAG
jgi:hypothetical protein